jgi:alkylated DNA repair dioxygenase AlkB
LVVVPDFVSPDEEQAIIDRIGLPKRISPEKSRNRIWRYGPGVAASGYDSGTVVEGPLPQWLYDIASRLERRGLTAHVPNAVSVNEYLPGQGIDFHTDKLVAGPVISTLGLGSACTMAFRKTWKAGSVIEVTSEPRMLIQMTGECRRDPWRHAIYNVTAPRYSLVFRYAV